MLPTTPMCYYMLYLKFNIRLNVAWYFLKLPNLKINRRKLTDGRKFDKVCNGAAEKENKLGPPLLFPEDFFLFFRQKLQN